MPRRTRGGTASETSTPQPNTQRMRPAYVPLQSILKEVDPEDDWPEFDATNAEIWSLDGRKCVDVFDSNLHGPFQIVGTLQVDKNQSQFHSREALRKPQDFESPIMAYAIDANPDPEVWVGTACGWIRMHSSKQYLPIFSKTTEAVKIMYSCLDIEEDMKDAKRILKVEALHYEYALQEGTGLTEESAVDLFRFHAKPILAHMHMIPDMRKSKLFIWLKHRFPDVHHGVTEQAKVHVNKRKTQTLQQVLSVRQPPPPRELSPSPSPSPSPPSSRSPSPALAPQQSTITVPIRPGTENEPNRITPTQMMLDHIRVQGPTHPNLTAQSLQTAMYQDFSIWYPRLAAAIVRLHAPEVLEHLPAPWRKTKLAESLQAVSKSLSEARRASEIAAGKKRPQRLPLSTATCNVKAISDDQWLVEAAEYQTILRRNKKSKPKPVASSTTARVGRPPADRRDVDNTVKHGDGAPDEEHQATSRAENKSRFQAQMESITSRSRTVTPEIVSVRKPPLRTPHSQKSLPPTMEARPSGKVTKLKPKTIKRRGDDSDDSIPNKRPRRLSSPSPDSDIEMSSPSVSAAHESDSDAESESAEAFDLDKLEDVDPDSPALLPKELNLARGPLGSLHCISRSCFFLEHEPESKEGRARMLSHFVEHEKEDPTVVLARREAELNRRPVSYLMEKLMERGDEVDTKGKVIPLPIIRRGV